MPEISRFYGIVIAMYFKDRTPPHFHASYGEFTAQISIEDLRVIHGELPRRVKNLVMEWADEHRDELLTKLELHPFKKTFFENSAFTII